MQYKKRESIGGKFAKKGVDIKDGQTIMINSGGKQVEGQFGTQNIFEIKTNAGEFVISVNQTSINSMVDEWGEESENWIGKKVKVHVIKQAVAGKFISVYYVAPEGYEMGENGFEKVGGQKSPKDDIPTINADEDTINVDEVPF